MDVDAPPESGAQPEHATPDRWSRLRTGGWRWDLVALAVVVGGYLLAQWLLFAGPEIYDPTFYVHEAVHWPGIHPANYWVIRSGLMVIVTVFEKLFGSSPATLFGVPIAATMVLAGSCYGLMRQFFGNRLVAAAGALAAVLNQDSLLNTAYLFPDPISTAVFVLAMFLLVLARPDGPLSTRWGTVVAGISGFLFGYTYLIREFSPFLAPTVLLALFLSRYTWRRTGVFVVGAVVAFCLELIYGQVIYHDPLIRLHVLTALPPTPLEREQQWAPLLANVHNIGESLLVFPRLLLSWTAGWLMILLLAVLAVSAAVLRRRPLLLFAGWVGSYWLIMGFIGITHGHGKLPIVEVGNIRYWYAVLPAVAMGGIGGLVELTRTYLPGPAWRTVALPGVAAGLVLVVPNTVEYAHCDVRGIGYSEPQQDWSALGSYLASPAGNRLHAIETDRYSGYTLTIYTHSTFGAGRWNGQVTGIIRPRKYIPHPHGPNAALLINIHTRKIAGALLKDWYPIWVSPNSFLAILAPRPSAIPGGVAGNFPPPDPALTPRWLDHLALRAFTPGHCGDSPYATKTS